MAGGKLIPSLGVVLLLSGVLTLAGPSAGADTISPGAFSPPSTVPNLVALGASFSQVQGVSCTSNADCVAVGIYGGLEAQGFIDVENNSVWAPAINVPGVASLGATGMTFDALSCSSTGNCAAGGLYNTAQFTGGSYLAFVVDEVNGVWQSAEMVPGTGSGAGSTAQVVSVSCPSNGSCSLGGYTTDVNGNNVAFVDDQVSGTWQSATVLTGVDLSAYSTPQATVSSISCTSAGNCVAGGYGWNGQDRYQDQIGGSGFVVSEDAGVWSAPDALSGIVTTSGSNVSQVNTVSCSSTADCVVGGTYFDGHEYQAFFASDSDGTLASAVEVPGTAALNAFSEAQVVAASCTSDGECTIAGTYEGTAGNGLTQTFVDSEVTGTWGTATQIPEESDDLQAAAQVTSLSCGSPGNCVVGGWIGTDGRLEAPYVDVQSGGDWSTLQRVDSGDAQNAQASSLPSASCIPNGSCTVGGYIQGNFGWYGILVRYDIAPTAPQDVHVTPTSGGALLTWSAPSSTGTSPISYVAVANGSATKCTTKLLTCRLTGLKGGFYTFTVTATGGGGSASSVPTTSTKIESTPSVPTHVRATAGDGSVSISWRPPVNLGGLRLIHYRVKEVVNGVSTTFTLGPTRTSLKLKLKALKTARMTVSAVNALGSGPASVEVSATSKR
jgi:hypothetical protein